MIEAIRWSPPYLRLIDQTRLPEQRVQVNLNTIEEVFDAIRTLMVRGAPAIGITAAYGLYLGMRSETPSSPAAFFTGLRKKIDYLAQARPTAVNLFWAMARIEKRLRQYRDADVATLKSQLLAQAIEIHDDDRRRCDAIGHHGAELVPDGAGILTHCNTGALATGGIGTALGVVYRAHERDPSIRIYANETRPVLQGARLTVWELVEANIPVTLICDSMGAFLMQKGKVDMIVLGADRIAADGAVANKIGTYALAVLARHHGLPFYVAAPLSTIDRAIDKGADIPIEMRDADEVRNVFGKCLITSASVNCWNPAFDITPPTLVTGIITEKGVLRPPYRENIRALFSNESA